MFKHIYRLFSVNSKKSAFAELRKHPGEMFVTDKAILVGMPDGNVLAIYGNFEGITDEEANQKVRNALTKLK